MKGNNIILVGMMGAGKSTVAKELVKLLDSFTIKDIDNLIEDSANLSIPEIFAQFKEDGFRQIESDVIKSVCQNDNQIVSTGGGAFENPENRKVLLNSGKVFYLYAPSQVLYDRINQRVDIMLKQGLIEEVKSILEKYNKFPTAMQGLRI